MLLANPLDMAVVVAGEAARLSTMGAQKISEIPYDFERRRLTIVVSEGNTPEPHLIITKGATSS